MLNIVDEQPPVFMGGFLISALPSPKQHCHCQQNNALL
jgi:hypothetical protein